MLGGARSGKSRYAEALIASEPAPWIYVATAQSFDAEMDERIRAHQERRDNRWKTIEAPLDLAGTLATVPQGAPVLIDCLTLWLTNHLLAEHELAQESRALVEVLARPRGPWVVVSNEVGLGIVPDNALARRFRDAAGQLNQAVAEVAGAVFLVAAGLAMKLK